MPQTQKIRLAGNPNVAHESFTFNNVAATKTFATRPTGALYLYADQDFWIRFDDSAAAAVDPSLFFVKNVLYGPFPFNVTTFSIIRDSADGSITTVYDKE